MLPAYVSGMIRNRCSDFANELSRPSGGVTYKETWNLAW
jgi:hypothetical protein